MANSAYVTCRERYLSLAPSPSPNIALTNALSSFEPVDLIHTWLQHALDRDMECNGHVEITAHPFNLLLERMPEPLPPY